MTIYRSTTETHSESVQANSFNFFLTYLSITTGSEGVSFLFPHDFFSQQRLKEEIKNICIYNYNIMMHKGIKHKFFSTISIRYIRNHYKINMY